ncbi:MAG: hypothetical protein JWM85_3104, partial [Acidimicrobiaceae bacterium]|nr:hypothetical protein [Acidimicrobiaceae bacterium]
LEEGPNPSSAEEGHVDTEPSNPELIDQIRRHVKRLRRRPAEGFSSDQLLDVLHRLEKLTGPIDEPEDGSGFVDEWRAEAKGRGIPLPPGRCALSDDGYHRMFEGSCTLCGEPATFESLDTGLA